MVMKQGNHTCQLRSLAMVVKRDVHTWQLWRMEFREGQPHMATLEFSYGHEVRQGHMSALDFSVVAMKQNE